MKSILKAIWEGLGCPKGKFPIYPYAGRCAMTGEEITEGAKVCEVITDTFSNIGDFLRYGDWVSPWVALWLSSPKEFNRNVAFIDGKVFFPVISLNSRDEEVVEKTSMRNYFRSLPAIKNSDRPTWMGLFREWVDLPPDTPCGGIITTDVKVRKFPNIEFCTISCFGLYIHCPDYNISTFLRFDLKKCLEILDQIIPLLEMGYTKTSIFRGLMTAKGKLSILEILPIEQRFSNYREMPEFLPALIVSGVKTGVKK